MSGARAIAKWLDISENKRIICISDIHGELDLFQKLLAKVGFGDADILILLGDLYLKGSRPDATLDYVMELAKRPNVHVLRGNCDWQHDKHQAWLDELPHIIETDGFIFVHAGIGEGPLNEQDAVFCMRNDAFMEKCEQVFDKWVVTGHWPVNNYCHEIICHNPIVDRKKRVIAIDGGNVVQSSGQLNAFIIEGDKFSFRSLDALPKAVATHRQKEAKGTLNVTWLDRFVEVVRRDKEFSVVRHVASGIETEVPSKYIHKEDDGRMSCLKATNHWPAIRVGDEVAVVESFSDRHLAKKDGIVGWISLETIE